MNRRLVVIVTIFVLFGLFMGYAITYLIPFKYFKEEIEQEKVKSINSVLLEQVSLKRLADMMSICADTCYYAVHNSKLFGYSIYSIRNDTISWERPKGDNSRRLLNALEMAYKLNLQIIWNNNADSFYRFQLPPEGPYWVTNVYILKHKSDTTQYVKEVEGRQKISPRVYLELKPTDYLLFLREREK